MSRLIFSCRLVVVDCTFVSSVIKHRIQFCVWFRINYIFRATQKKHTIFAVHIYVKARTNLLHEVVYNTAYYHASRDERK